MKNNEPIVTPYYRNGNGKDIIVHTCFQGPDGLFQFGEQRLSEEEIDKLIALLAHHRWIIVMYADPQDYRSENILGNPDNIDVSKLSNETLYKIRDRRPLGENGFQDVLNSIK